MTGEQLRCGAPVPVVFERSARSHCVSRLEGQQLRKVTRRSRRFDLRTVAPVSGGFRLADAVTELDAL